MLSDNNIPFEDIDVSASKAARDEMVSKSGSMSVPVIDINGSLIVGHDEKALKEKLGLAK